MELELVRTTFIERLADIESYFELVSNIEQAVGSGGAEFNVDNQVCKITPKQQKIMHSAIYLHLYNLVESTISKLIEAVEKHALEGINGDLKVLTENMKKLYIKAITEPHQSINENKRLEKTMELLEQALGSRPITVKIPAGGGGNWDNKNIITLSKKIGIEINFSDELSQKINNKIYHDEGPIRFIKTVRNNLAHGNLSFVECGEYYTASQLRVLIDIVKEYLSCVIDSYEEFIEQAKYKIPQ